MRFTPDHCVNVVLAVCVIHNILRKMCGKSYIPPGTCDMEDINYNLVAGDWRDADELHGLMPSTTRNPLHDAKVMRQKLTNFVITPEGEVPWQYNSMNDL